MRERANYYAGKPVLVPDHRAIPAFQAIYDENRRLWNALADLAERVEKVVQELGEHDYRLGKAANVRRELVDEVKALKGNHTTHDQELEDTDTNLDKLRDEVKALREQYETHTHAPEFAGGAKRDCGVTHAD
jgi:chromosome segregation ATPase